MPVLLFLARIAGHSAAWATACLALPLQSFAGPPISNHRPSLRMLIPSDGGTHELQRELITIAENYRRTHPEENPVEIIMGGGGGEGGENFSSLKELVTTQLAGSPPDLAAVECSEVEALSQIEILRTLVRPIDRDRLQPFLKKIPPGLIKKNASTLPLQRSHLILAINISALKNARLWNSKTGSPKTWKSLIDLAQAFSGTGAITLPLSGPRGLLAFEALTRLPLWVRRGETVLANRELRPWIDELNLLLSKTGLLRNEESPERGLELFLTQQTFFLITESHWVPQLQSQAKFEWRAGPIPTHGQGARSAALPKNTPLVTGSDLLIVRESPAVWKWLHFLYSQKVITDRLAAGASPHLSRTSAPNGIRYRQEWISALKTLFSGSKRPTPTEDIFTGLDAAFSKTD